MFRIIRFAVTSILLISFLSLTYDKKPLFTYIYKYSKNIIGPVQGQAIELLRIGYFRTKDFSEQFFDNNLPINDSLEYKLSAPERTEAEIIDEMDEDQLNDIFGN